MVMFTRNHTQHVVSEDVASMLLTSALAALTDARDGIKLEKSPAYLKLQSQMSMHVYQPKAAPGPSAEDIRKGLEQVEQYRHRHPSVMVYWDEAGHFDPSAWLRLKERNGEKMFMGGREGGKSIFNRVMSARRAYNAMIQNMAPYSAITRLSERFGVSYDTIRGWVQ